MIKKLTVAVVLCLSINTPSFALDLNQDKALGALGTALSAVTVSDADVKTIARKMALQSDTKNTISSENDAYGKRLANIIKGWQNTDGLTLNFKVYMAKEVNAFAMADGTVRVNSGLLDLMTDDEVRFVLGHEIGHVKLGHSKSQLRASLATSTFRQGASAVGGTVGLIADSVAGDLLESFSNAQFSQKDEKSADIYGLKLMKAKKINTRAAVTALEKLAELGDSSSVMSSHPSSKQRAALIKKEIAKK